MKFLPSNKPGHVVGWLPITLNTNDPIQKGIYEVLKAMKYGAATIVRDLCVLGWPHRKKSQRSERE